MIREECQNEINCNGKSYEKKKREADQLDRKIKQKAERKMKKRKQSEEEEKARRNSFIYSSHTEVVDSSIHSFIHPSTTTIQVGAAGRRRPYR